MVKQWIGKARQCVGEALISMHGEGAALIRAARALGSSAKPMEEKTAIAAPQEHRTVEAFLKEMP